MSAAASRRADVITLSWHTMIEFEPPLFGCVVSESDFSLVALKAPRQCVLAIPTRELVEIRVAGETIELPSQMNQRRSRRRTCANAIRATLASVIPNRLQESLAVLRRHRAVRRQDRNAVSR